MTQDKRQRLWAADVVGVVLLTFVAGTSFACWQKEVGSVGAEECCQKHCHHNITGATAAKCCQQFQAKASPMLPTSSSAKSPLTDFTLPLALIPPAILQHSEQALIDFPTGEGPPLSPPFY